MCTFCPPSLPPPCASFVCCHSLSSHLLSRSFLSPAICLLPLSLLMPSSTFPLPTQIFLPFLSPSFCFRSSAFLSLSLAFLFTVLAFFHLVSPSLPPLTHLSVTLAPSEGQLAWDQNEQHFTLRIYHRWQQDVVAPLLDDEVWRNSSYSPSLK